MVKGVLYTAGVVAGGGFQVLKLCAWTGLVVSLSLSASCAVEKIAASGRTRAELQMARAADAENRRVVEVQKSRRIDAERAYERARKQRDQARKASETAESRLLAVILEAQEMPTTGVPECPMPCRLPRELRRALDPAGREE